MLLFLKTQLRYTPFGEWSRPEVYSRIIGTQKFKNDRNIYPCKQ